MQHQGGGTTGNTGYGGSLGAPRGVKASLALGSNSNGVAPLRTVRELRNDMSTSIGDVLEILQGEITSAQNQFSALQEKLNPVLGASRIGSTEESAVKNEPSPIVSQHKANALACLEQIRALRATIGDVAASVEV